MVVAETTGKSVQRVRPHHTLSETNFSRNSSTVKNSSVNNNIYCSPAPSIHEQDASFPDLRLSSAKVPEQRQAPLITTRHSSWPVKLQSDSENTRQADDDPEDLVGLNEMSAAKALHKACRRGNLTVVEHILDVLQFKNLDSADDNGDTALHICAQSGNYRVCEILLEVTQLLVCFILLVNLDVIPASFPSTAPN